MGREAKEREKGEGGMGGGRSAFITYICTTGKLQFHNEPSLYFLHDDVNTIHTVQDILHRGGSKTNIPFPPSDGQMDRQRDR